MGRVYRDKRTGWWIADYVDAWGTRRRIKASREPREARKTLAVLEAKAIRDRLLEIRPLKPASFGEFGDVFLSHAKAQLRSWRRYRDSLKNLKSFFGNPDLTAIGAEWIERYKQARQEHVEPATVNRDLACLRRMLNLAMAWGFARENPFRVVKLLRERNARLRYLLREEFDRLIQACPAHLRPIIVVAVHTGMRQGELLALTWADVDLESGFASVNDPKNGTPRKAPLNDTAREALAALREESRSTRVFNEPDGSRLTNWSLHKQFRKAITAAKIEDFRFHDLRHTCGSWLAMQGVDLRRIQMVLGQKTLAMAMRYSHLSPDHVAQAVGKLDALMRPPSRPGQKA